MGHGLNPLVFVGHSENGTQRWFCNDCRKSFQLTYRYNARKPGVKEQITELTLNSSGVRDTAYFVRSTSIGRILGINPNTVVAELKKNAQCKPFDRAPSIEEIGS